MLHRIAWTWRKKLHGCHGVQLAQGENRSDSEVMHDIAVYGTFEKHFDNFSFSQKGRCKDVALIVFYILCSICMVGVLWQAIVFLSWRRLDE